MFCESFALVHVYWEMRIIYDCMRVCMRECMRECACLYVQCGTLSLTVVWRAYTHVYIYYIFIYIHAYIYIYIQCIYIYI